MKGFRYRKWFFDILTPKGDYIILFISIVATGWKKYAYFQLHAADYLENKGFSGRISFVKETKFEHETNDTIVFENGIVKKDTHGFELNFQFPELMANLKFRADEKKSRNPMYLKTGQNTGLTWAPLCLFSTVDGEIKFNSAEKYLPASSNGYVDYVESCIFPLNVPVRKLFWGRLQHPECSMSWSVTETKSGERTSKLFLRLFGEDTEFNGVDLDTVEQKKGSLSLSFPEHYILKGANRNLSFTITVRDHEEALVNDFMAYAGKYGKIAEKLLRYVSHNPRGIKFQAFADVQVFAAERQIFSKNLPVIDEYVCFGGK